MIGKFHLGHHFDTLYQDNTDFRFAKEGNRLEVDTWLGITVTLQGVDATIVVPPFYS